jgi:membrane protease YdiL (CAAX protease family)
MPPPPGPGPDVLPATWTPLETVPVFFIALVIAVIAGALGQAFTTACQPQFFSLWIPQEAAFAAVPLFWVTVVHRTPAAALGLPRDPAKDLRVGLAGGVAIVAAAYVVDAVVSGVTSLILGHSPGQPDQVPTCLHGAGFASFAVLAVVLAPLGEETLFRGFLFKSLRARYSFWPSAVISGAVFGLVHIQGSLFLLIVPSLMLVGIGLAWVYERRQSLLASMVAHGTFNLVGIVLVTISRR